MMLSRRRLLFLRWTGCQTRANQRLIVRSAAQFLRPRLRPRRPPPQAHLVHSPALLLWPTCSRTAERSLRTVDSSGAREARAQIGLATLLGTALFAIMQ